MFVNWIINNNENIYNLVSLYTFVNIISLISYNFVKLSCYSLFWNNINIKVKILIKNNKLEDYITSLLHSIGLLFLIICNFLTVNNNYIYKDIVLYSISYFIYDIYVIIEKKYNKLFLYHHILALTNLIIGYNYEIFLIPTIMSLFIGELSNPFQNTYKICKIIKHKNTDCILKVFICIFFVLRLFIFPIYWINSDIFNLNSNISKIYNFIFLLGSIVSGIWVKNMFKILKKNN